MSDLLPPNATPQERALSEATARIGSVPTPVRTVWNPDTCQADALPWLAWAFSVDEWNPAWTEAQKRGAIKNSIAVHKKKGTIGAMRDALTPLGYDLEVTEWFQKEPAGDPYTFGIRINVDQVGLGTEAEYDQVERVAISAKNLRSHLETIEVNATTACVEYFAAKVLSGEIVNIDAEPD